ncbi:YaaR family protein [Indiicoccus explosivorum]|uniref:YaaR family protein n=1 Tax=Indiicoccus explosivorum TaxID=1917864 RepID=UPI000B44162D|nr:YaaR family protein [Indiicoccus explosivorum]
MKINHDLRTGINNARADRIEAAAPAGRFSQLVAGRHQQLQTEQLTRLFGDITLAGDRLARSRSIREFTKFKGLVKHFLQEAVDQGMDLKQSHTWNRFGEGKRLKIVETVDSELLLLMEELLDQEKSSIDLLARIGEIKGMLINLYT